MSAILIATLNPGKERELRRLVEEAGYRAVPLRDAGPDAPYEESGMTYEENGVGKARHYAALTGRVAIADDSGIEVDALGGAPGPRSARYGGEGLDDDDRCRLLLEALRQVPDEKRGARYVAVVAIARPDGETRSFRGACEGRIGREPKGEGGFGYDPLFFYPAYQATFAEIPEERKHAVSHRGRAFAALSGFLKTDEGRRFVGAAEAPR